MGIDTDGGIMIETILYFKLHPMIEKTHQRGESTHENVRSIR